MQIRLVTPVHNLQIIIQIINLTRHLNLRTQLFNYLIKLGTLLFTKVGKPKIKYKSSMLNLWNKNIKQTIYMSRLTTVNNTLNYKIFLKFFNLITSTKLDFFKLDSSYKILLLTPNKFSIYSFSTTKLYTHFIKFTELLNLIFYFNIHIFYWGNHKVKKELNFLNLKSPFYEYYKITINLLKLPFNRVTYPLIEHLYMFAVKVLFIFDYKYYKNMFFFLKHIKFFIISIIGTNENLFNVDYAIPTNNNNILNYYLILKVIIFYKKYAQKSKFRNYKLVWNRQN